MMARRPKDTATHGVTRTRRFRRFLLVVGVLATVLVLAVGYAGSWVLHRSFFAAHSVSIEGNVHETTAQISSLSGITSHTALIDINPSLISSRLDRLTWVSGATLSKHWPHSVTITVHERKVCAVTRENPSTNELVSCDGYPLGSVPTSNLVQVAADGWNGPAHWPFAHWAAPAVVVARSLPVAFANQVVCVSVNRSGIITLHMTTPVTFVLGSDHGLGDKYVAVAAVLAHASLTPGEVVDVSVPSDVTVHLK